MRSSRPVVALAAGLACLVVAGVVAVQSARTALVRSDDQHTLLQSTAHTTSIELSEQFERERTIALMLAQNPSFADFYTLPGTRLAKIAAHDQAVQRTEIALQGLRTLLPGGIGEACFIDVRGSENARMVNGVAAKAADLSPDESKSPFFAPAFGLHAGQVYQAAAYVSGDTHDWVVAQATPIAVHEQNVAIVHFEVPVETLRASAAAGAAGFDVRVVDAKTGSVIIDTQRPQLLGAELGNPKDRSFASLASFGLLHDQRVINGQDAVFARVPGVSTLPGVNANDWIVVASAAQFSSGWRAALTPWSIGLGLLATFLLLLAVVSYRRVRRNDREERRSAKADHELMTTRFGDLTDALTQVAQGDLGVRLPLSGLGDESMDRLVTSFDETLGRLRLLVADAQANGDQLTEAAGDLRSMAAAQVNAATEQASAVTQTTATIQELASTAAHIAETTREVSDVAEQTLRLAVEGRDAVGDSVAAMDRIADRVNSMSESSAELELQIGEIGRILELIDELSDQTNLLALNAAIEAARAGDHGRGFAVVAVEVRKLAERAQGATAHIQSIVTQIRARTSASVLAGEQGTREVAEGSSLALNAARSLERIADMAHRTTESTQEISAATEQQRSASQQVVAAMNMVADGSRLYAAGSHQTASAADEISALSGRMRASIETFNVAEDGSSPTLTG